MDSLVLPPKDVAQRKRGLSEWNASVKNDRCASEVTPNSTGSIARATPRNNRRSPENDKDSRDGEWNYDKLDHCGLFDYAKVIQK